MKTITLRFRRPHRHDPEFVAYRIPRPEGGTYYQLTCIRRGCRKRLGPRRFKPQQIVAPSVLFSVKVRAEWMDDLMQRAEAADMAPVDLLNTYIRERLTPGPTK